MSTRVEAVAGSAINVLVAANGGHDQSIMLRGNDIDAPVLLFLEGTSSCMPRASPTPSALVMPGLPHD
jgi:hypothetical protein